MDSTTVRIVKISEYGAISLFYALTVPFAWIVLLNAGYILPLFTSKAFTASNAPRAAVHLKKLHLENKYCCFFCFFINRYPYHSI